MLPFSDKTLFQRRHEVQDFAASLGNLRRNHLLTLLFLLNERQHALAIGIMIPAGVPAFTLQMVNELGRQLQFPPAAPLLAGTSSKARTSSA